MPFILTACGGTSLARLPIADVQRDGALCVSVLSRYLSAPWVVLLPRSDGDAAARARVSIGRSILAGVARRRRSRDSRTLRKIPRDESTFRGITVANRFSSFVILANISIVREILSSRIRSLFSAAKILLIEEKITNHFVLQDRKSVV